MHSIFHGNLFGRIPIFERNEHYINILSDYRTIGCNRLAPTTHSYPPWSCLVPCRSSLILFIGSLWEKISVDGRSHNFFCLTFYYCNWLLYQIRLFLGNNTHYRLLLHFYHQLRTCTRACYLDLCLWHRQPSYIQLFHDNELDMRNHHNRPISHPHQGLLQWQSCPHYRVHCRPHLSNPYLVLFYGDINQRENREGD